MSENTNDKGISLYEGDAGATKTKPWSRLTSSTVGFDQRLRGFGVVTVRDADVYTFVPDKCKSLKDFLTALDNKEMTPLTTLKTLKVANVTVEAGTKTISGGRDNGTLVSVPMGTTARLERQDALGNAEALEARCGAVIEHYYEHTDNNIANDHSGETAGTHYDALHISSDHTFGALTIVGKSYFIDKEKGSQVPVKIIFWKFAPDNVFNLTQDAAGDASTFDRNGSLMAIDLTVGSLAADNNTVDEQQLKTFYSIISENIDQYTA